MRHTILVADDDESIRDLLVMVLGEAGYTTLQADNGETAVELAVKNRPDAAIIDVMMPVMDGFAACRTMKADPRTTDIPVLLFTALAHTDTKVRGLEDGATDYITKPFENAELLARLRKVLHDKDQRDILLSEILELRSLLAASKQGEVMTKPGHIRVFAASPSDVKDEREVLTRQVDRLNRVFAGEVTLECVKWETHVIPGMGRPQEVVNRQIGPYNIFVGIMWKRFGTPTGKVDSGTQEEFEAAVESWEKTGQPEIMFYFKQSPYILRSPDEADQVRRVIEFRSKLQEQSVVGEYKTVRDFERTISEHLTRTVKRMIDTDQAFKA